MLFTAGRQELAAQESPLQKPPREHSLHRPNRFAEGLFDVEPCDILPYATLGLAEDTWALNEGVIDDATFLQQTYDIDSECQQMFLLSLERLRRGKR